MEPGFDVNTEVTNLILKDYLNVKIQYVKTSIITNEVTIKIVFLNAVL